MEKTNVLIPSALKIFSANKNENDSNVFSVTAKNLKLGMKLLVLIVNSTAQLYILLSLSLQFRNALCIKSYSILSSTSEGLS